MGPSGCGKTTLLNTLASRPTGGAATTANNNKEASSSSSSPSLLINGTTPPSKAAARHLSRFVEQDDSLIGALTVRETLAFAARLAGTTSAKKRDDGARRTATVDGLIEAFGLRAQADAIVGTPLRKGISGGQKRRVGIASQLITGPMVLFLDEPTSGLDSAASFEVVSYLRSVARRNNVSLFLSLDTWSL